MRTQMFLAVMIMLNCFPGFAIEYNDTIQVNIDLTQKDSNGIFVEVYPPAMIIDRNYLFPKSIPGIYEYINSENYRTEIKNLQKGLTYKVSSTVDNKTGICSADFYYKQDSIYILNWHNIIGFYEDFPDLTYKIRIKKHPHIYGAGSLNKKSYNDSTDVFTVTGYKDLIHSPILYSKPDTVSFYVGDSKFLISKAGNDTTKTSADIRSLLEAPLKEILRYSEFQQKEYSFLYYSEYSPHRPGLRALEHPNSTVVYYHSALLNDDILIASSIHEYIHSIYAPLRIRSEVINNFDFREPVCDEFLWFYEGVTEYLSYNILRRSNFISNEDFMAELNLSNKYYENINLSETSKNIYGIKEQFLFDNFYTKGSLLAFILDVELVERSNGATNLLVVMQNLQFIYTPDKPFNSQIFLNEFSKTSGVDIQEFILQYVNKKKKINFEETLDKVGYTQKEKDTLIYSFGQRVIYNYMNTSNNSLEFGFKGSILNKSLKTKIVRIIEINGDPITWYNADALLHPSTGDELELLINTGGEDFIFKSKPKLMKRKISKTSWLQNENFNTDLSINYWGRE